MNRRSFLPLLSLFGIPLLPRTARAQSSAPKIYRAKLTQSGEGAPTADEMVNTLGCDVSWSRRIGGVGEYVGLFDPQFSTSAKVFCHCPVRDLAGDITTGTAATFTMDGIYNGISINAYGEGEDGLIGRRDIEGNVFVCIEVFE